MRIVFMGSAELACPSLDMLCRSERETVVAVVTQPDRPKGRRRQRSPCAVGAHVAQREIPVLTPEKVNTADSVDAIRSLAPDVIVVVAYGQLLKRPLLEMPPLGCLNVHTSLLPAYRGAAPIQWAIANGESETGVTTMRLNERMDAGDLILQRRVPIGPDDTAADLHDRLAEAGATLLRETLDALHAGSVAFIPQDPSQATPAPKLSKQDGRIDWTRPAAELHNRIRGFNPWPGCFARPGGANGPVLKIWRARVEPGRGGKPGTLVEAGQEGPLVETGRDALRLLEVQPEGGRRMGGDAYTRGHAATVGECWE